MREDLMRVFFLAAIFLMFIITAQAHASFTGLITIPNADVVPKYEFVIQPELNGAASGFGTQTRLFNTQFGITDRLEAGLDFNLSPDTSSWALFNVKYVPFKSERSGFAAAAGIYNCGPNIDSCAYGVITENFHVLRFHYGLMEINDGLRWFAGVDHDINEKCILMTEFTSGAGNFAGIGVTYQMSGNFSVLVGALFPNSGDGDLEYSLQIEYTGLYNKSGD